LSIHKEMTIDEIFTTYPAKGQKMAHLLGSKGLSCVGCHAATYETLEMGMLSHGLTELDIDEMCTELNKIVDEVVDETEIHITDSGAEQIDKIRKSEKKETYALRFGVRPGGCGGFEYSLDFSKKAGLKDQIFKVNGIEVHIHESMIERLLGSTIDYVHGLQGSGFKITNPNVKSSCSCGSSQSF